MLYVVESLSMHFTTLNEFYNLKLSLLGFFINTNINNVTHFGIIILYIE